MITKFAVFLTHPLVDPNWKKKILGTSCVTKDDRNHEGHCFIWIWDRSWKMQLSLDSAFLNFIYNELYNILFFGTTEVYNVLTKLFSNLSFKTASGFDFRRYIYAFSVLMSYYIQILLSYFLVQNGKWFLILQVFNLYWGRI